MHDKVKIDKGLSLATTTLNDLPACFRLSSYTSEVLQVVKIVTLATKFAECRFGIIQELSRRTSFCYNALAHYDYSVYVYDGTKTMCDN